MYVFQILLFLSTFASACGFSYSFTLSSVNPQNDGFVGNVTLVTSGLITPKLMYSGIMTGPDGRFYRSALGSFINITSYREVDSTYTNFLPAFTNPIAEINGVGSVSNLSASECAYAPHIIYGTNRTVEPLHCCKFLDLDEIDGLEQVTSWVNIAYHQTTEKYDIWQQDAGSRKVKLGINYQIGGVQGSTIIDSYNCTTYPFSGCLVNGQPNLPVPKYLIVNVTGDHSNASIIVNDNQISLLSQLGFVSALITPPDWTTYYTLANRAISSVNTRRELDLCGQTQVYGNNTASIGTLYKALLRTALTDITVTASPLLSLYPNITFDNSTRELYFNNVNSSTVFITTFPDVLVLVEPIVNFVDVKVSCSALTTTINYINHGNGGNFQYSVIDVNGTHHNYEAIVTAGPGAIVINNLCSEVCFQECYVANTCDKPGAVQVDHQSGSFLAQSDQHFPLVVTLFTLVSILGVISIGMIVWKVAKWYGKRRGGYKQVHQSEEHIPMKRVQRLN